MIMEDSSRHCCQEIWKREGCPIGKDFDNWTRAEMELKSELCLRTIDPINLRQIVVPRPAITKRPLRTISARVPSGCLRPIAATK